LEQQILRQIRDLTKAEQTVENLSTALTGISLKAGKTIKRASILAKQLEKVFLSLIMAREEAAAMTPKIGCIICRLIISRI
jgi:hypothetical protein